MATLEGPPHPRGPAAQRDASTSPLSSGASATEMGAAHRQPKARPQRTRGGAGTRDVGGAETPRDERRARGAAPPATKTCGKPRAAATYPQARVSVLQRRDPPVLVFDRDGAYLDGWGIGAFANP